MGNYNKSSAARIVLILLLGLVLACAFGLPGADDEAPTTVPPTEALVATPTPTRAPADPVADKWGLWVDGPHLRGANIYQRRVYPELDGPEFMGSGPVGPPYTQEDFDRLAALGANYVNISHPGLFTETPPHTLDQDIQDNLDKLLGMIAQADMFAVVSFRTGPGRSEFTFFWDDDWFDPSYINDSMWQDRAAQDGWVEMWRCTAERYRHNPIVVGYDLMVEPNSNEVGSHALDAPLDVWDPDEFYAEYGGTLYDWNQLHPRVTAAIREVDPDTPILVGGMGYSGIAWLPYLEPIGDLRTVWRTSTHHISIRTSGGVTWNSPTRTYSTQTGMERMTSLSGPGWTTCLRRLMISGPRMACRWRSTSSVSCAGCPARPTFWTIRWTCSSGAA
jgi:hypothetical protein